MSDSTNHPHADEDIVEVYAAGNSVEADRIVLLLEGEGIEAQGRETSVPTLPGAGNNRFLITVFESAKDRAVATIKRAIDDGVLPPDGTFF